MAAESADAYTVKPAAIRHKCGGARVHAATLVRQTHRVFGAHTATALVAKGAEPSVPLWAYLVAAWVFDLTGVGHWLPVGGLLVATAVLVARRRGLSMRAGLTLGAVAMSHSLLDLVVGAQFWPNSAFVGLHLRGGPEFAVELAVTAVAMVVYLRRTGTDRALPVVVALAILVAASALYAMTLPSDGASVARGLDGRAVFGFELVALIGSSALLIAHDRRVPVRLKG